MKKFVAIIMLLSSTSFAANQWIGGGQAAIAKATIKSIKFNTTGTVAYFKINESSTTFASTKVWMFDINNDQGKSIVASILSSMATSTEVVFFETTCHPTLPLCDISDFIVGSEHF